MGCVKNGLKMFNKSTNNNFRFGDKLAVHLDLNKCYSSFKIIS